MENKNKMQDCKASLYGCNMNKLIRLILLSKLSTLVAIDLSKVQ